MKFLARVGCCLSLAVLLSGCGGGSNLPEGETGTVSGKVTFQGQTSVPEGSVVLFMRDKDGLMATGKVGSDGAYSLTMREGSTVVTGKYRISVTPPNPTESMDQDEIMKRQMEGTLPDPAAVKEVPEKYRSPESSPLNFEVKSGSNTFDIDMQP